MGRAGKKKEEDIEEGRREERREGEGRGEERENTAEAIS